MDVKRARNTLDHMRLPPGVTASVDGDVLSVKVQVTDVRDMSTPIKIVYTCTFDGDPSEERLAQQVLHGVETLAVHEAREWVTLRGRCVVEPDHV